VRPLFDSYNKSVRTKTVDEFVESVLRWVDEHFTLPSLRYGKYNPVGEIAEKAVCMSAFLTIWHAELTKTHSFSLFFWRFCPLGIALFHA